MKPKISYNTIKKNKTLEEYNEFREGNSRDTKKREQTSE